MPRAGKRITPHAERVTAALDKKEWRTSAEIAEMAKVAGSTARTYLALLVQAGKAEMRETWPSLTYRLRK